LASGREARCPESFLAGIAARKTRRSLGCGAEAVCGTFEYVRTGIFERGNVRAGREGARLIVTQVIVTQVASDRALL